MQIGSHVKGTSQHAQTSQEVEHFNMTLGITTTRNFRRHIFRYIKFLYQNQLCTPQHDTCHPREQIIILDINYEENNRIIKSVSPSVTVGKYTLTSTLEQVPWED
jgi:hypothetical protein